MWNLVSLVYRHAAYHQTHQILQIIVLGLHVFMPFIMKLTQNVKLSSRKYFWSQH